MKIKLILLLSIVMLAILFVLSWPDEKVKVVFCDVGQGDGAIVMQETRQMLIDVGPDNKKMLACMERHLPFWDKKIEVVIISHWDSDHSGALEDILKNYQIEKIVSSTKSTEQNIYTDILRQGDVIEMNKIVFEVLLPDNYVTETMIDDNANSLIGMLSYKTNKFLFLGDIPIEMEQRLVWRTLQSRANRKVDVLKVSHHGSKSGTSKELLEVVRPTMAVISVGEKNKFGHPDEEVIEKLKEKGIEIRRTDTAGDVVIEIN